VPDFQALIKQAMSQLDRATEDLRIWESYEAVTVTDEKGKTINLRSQMVATCKHNMQTYRIIIAALEKQAEKPN
jgi:hypothetical protein